MSNTERKPMNGRERDKHKGQPWLFSIGDKVYALMNPRTESPVGFENRATALANELYPEHMHVPA